MAAQPCPQKVSADSGFFSGREALTASGIDAYVPDSNMAHALNRGGRVRHGHLSIAHVQPDRTRRNERLSSVFGPEGTTGRFRRRGLARADGFSLPRAAELLPLPAIARMRGEEQPC